MPIAPGSSSDGAEVTADRPRPYDPAEWSRRLDRAREARNKVLAERENRQRRPGDDQPYRLRVPVEHAWRAAEPRDAEVPGRVPGPRLEGRRTIRRAAGFAAGIVMGLLLAALVVLFGTTTPSGRSDPTSVDAHQQIVPNAAEVATE